MHINPSSFYENALVGGSLLGNMSSIVISNCDFISNTAIIYNQFIFFSHGGAIFCQSCHLNLVNVTMMNNFANFGGAIEAINSYDNISSSFVNMTNVIMVNNHAIHFFGGAVSSNGTIDMNNVTFNNNTAPQGVSSQHFRIKHWSNVN
jgi:hypothetical protein